MRLALLLSLLLAACTEWPREDACGSDGQCTKCERDSDCTASFSCCGGLLCWHAADTGPLCDAACFEPGPEEYEGCACVEGRCRWE